MYLNCHTALSFKYGTMTVQQLFEESKRCGVHKLVLTEINNTASFIEMLRLCEKNIPGKEDDHPYGDPYMLQIAVGVEFRSDHELQYIAIAKNNNGFEAINRFLSYHNREKKAFPKRAPEFEDVFIIYPYPVIEPEHLRAYEYIGVTRHQLNQFAVQSAYQTFSEKYVILQPVTFNSRIGFNVHRLMRAIDMNTLLSKLPPHQQAHPDEMMLPKGELEKHFKNFPALVANTKRLLDDCRIEFDLRADKNKVHVSGDAGQDWDILVTKAWEGFQARYDVNRPGLRERFDRELRIIKQKNFCSYYLIAYDLISYANEKGFAYVGRGSGANSVVAYCLGITNVDPIELDLYFERFLNEERTTPPDFDIDFSWDNRDEIYEYIFRRYGRDHVCLLGTHVTYQGRSILRELGKVFGLPKEEIDVIVEEPAKNRDRDHITRLIFKYAQYFKDLPANLSIHAGGVLITEKPVYAFTATDTPPKGYPISHFDMHSAEDMGIFKFDILSQRGLGHIKETVVHIKRNRGLDVDVNRFEDFKKDEKIRSLLRNSRAMGCFYVESPSMRSLLAKLRCEDYLTLVAASSIIRPGVASSGMMRTYIERFHTVRNGGTYEAIHPKMDELMKETYGVMVYQEDVIKVAHHFAGISLTEADVLRRGMSGKYRSREEFNRVKNRFYEECQKKGYEQKVIDRVWYEIESFSGYSFAKGHSASYAVESYQSLYLKAHFPLEFMVGVINNFGGFYKTEFYFHEARMSGGKIEPPCVNNSEHLTTIRGDQIFMGFVHLKGLESRLAHEIGQERRRNGPFNNLNDFLKRMNAGLEQTRILIRIGAFRFTGKDKQHLLWEAMLHQSRPKKNQRATELFDTIPKEYPLPQLKRHAIEDAFDEIELLGFCVSDPFSLLATSPRGDTVARELPEKSGTFVRLIGYVVTTKDTLTKTRQHMQFGTFLDCEGQVFDTVHFPDVTRKYPFRGRGFYEMRGKVVEDFGVPVIEVSHMEKCPIVNKRAEQLMLETTGRQAGQVRQSDVG
jgi:DNA-directed DNA polymerase III PolC